MITAMPMNNAGLGSLPSEQRTQLVQLAVQALQQRASEIEVMRLLEQYIEFNKWGPQLLIVRRDIVLAAREALQQPAAKVTAKQVVELDDMQVVPLSEMEPGGVRWLWPGRIPLGKVTVICGAGQGKTCLALDLAARVSAGAAWPDGAEGGESGAGHVLLLNGEDHWGDTIRPRLTGGGANLENITAIAGINARRKSGSIEPRNFDLERDIPALWRRIQKQGNVRLVIIDSLAAHCGFTNVNSGVRIRWIIAQLVKLADEFGVAVVVISSGTKSDWPVKHAWQVDCDVLDPELRLWVPVKFTHGRCPSGLAYRVTDTGIGWESPPGPLTADRLPTATAKQERNCRLRETAEWLKTFLAVGPRPAKEVLDAGGAAGWSAYQIKRAKQALGVACYKELAVNGKWMWRIRN